MKESRVNALYIIMLMAILFVLSLLNLFLSESIFTNFSIRGFSFGVIQYGAMSILNGLTFGTLFIILHKHFNKDFIDMVGINSLAILLVVFTKDVVTEIIDFVYAGLSGYEYGPLYYTSGPTPVDFLQLIFMIVISIVTSLVLGFFSTAILIYLKKYQSAALA